MTVVHVVGAAIVRGGRCLVTRRSATMSAPLKWELPGGKVEPGEEPRAALARELAEELGLEVEVGERLGRGRGRSAGRDILLDVYLATVVRGELALAEHSEHGWFADDELDALDWPEADLAVLPALKAWLARGRAGP